MSRPLLEQLRDASLEVARSTRPERSRALRARSEGAGRIVEPFRGFVVDSTSRMTESEIPSAVEGDGLP